MFQRITVQRGYRLVFDTFNTAVPATTYTRRTKGRKMLQIHLILQTIGRDVEGVRPTILTGIRTMRQVFIIIYLFVNTTHLIII